ncbi:heterokaryon incompatibility protein-domain-containing protein [Xylariaceae sp. FL1019]|nr:heterokaryon incompatibility protein-domain-containing protein [Xylariaceae sp. FL1019]
MLSSRYEASSASDERKGYETGKLPSRCEYCARLSISSLIDLARIDFRARTISAAASYQHQPSLDDLEASAIQGCDLCTLIVNSLNATPRNAEYAQYPLANEESTWFYLRTLKESNIGLSIDAAHLYPYDRLDQAQVFDTLVIHIGPLPGRFSRTRNIKPYDHLSFTIFRSPTCHRANIGGFDIGRLDHDVDLGSDVSLNVARQWLNTCRDHHGECSKALASRLPSRVLDVSHTNANNDIRSVATEGASGFYVTLSHCWGGNVSLRLLSNNAEALQTEIRLKDLPATFRDAVTITRALNIPYLWIDALCIVQDSKADWDHESKQMGSYYGNAVLTLCASAAENSTAGIFRQHVQPQPDEPTPVFLNLFAGSESKAQVYTKGSFKGNVHESLRSLDEQGPLSSRGWTLQESVLSQRLLYVGEHQMYWKCLHGYQSMDGLPEGSRTPQNTYNALRLVLSSGAQPIDSRKPRRLSIASDKLPAVSGLARLIHPSIGGEYLAGLWSFDIHRGLNWKVNDSRPAGSHATDYRSPSWSWAAKDSTITSNGMQFRSDKFTLQLLNQEIRLRDPSNPYGEVKGGYIYVRGFVKPLFRSIQIMGSQYPSKFCGDVFYDDMPDQKNILGAIHRLRIRQDTIDNKDCLLVFWQDAGGHGDLDFDLNTLVPDDCIALIIGFSNESHAAAGIILRQEKCKHDFIFKRIGLCELSDVKMEWMNTWESRTLMLV